MILQRISRRTLHMLVLIAAAKLCGPSLAAAQALAPTPAFREQVLVNIPAETTLKTWTVAGDHVAWVETENGKWTVMLDGKQQGGIYEGVEDITQSEDGAHLHFFGKLHGKWVHVLDGKESSPGYWSVTTVVLQPGGSSYAYTVCAEKKNCFLVVNDKTASEQYERISAAQYSPDGKHLAIIGWRNKENHAMVDGKQTGPDFGDYEPTEWGFDPSGRFYAAVMSDVYWTYLVGDKLCPRFDVISRMAFSPDGQHYAYGGANVHPGFGKQKIDGAIVLDGQTGKMYDGSGMAGVWTAALGTVAIANIGVQKLYTDFHGVSNPVFGPDGKVLYAVREGKGDVVVMNGDAAGPPVDELVSPIAFDNDGKHWAYIGTRDKSFLEIRDNQPGKALSVGARVGAADWVVLSNDGSRLAYELVRGGTDYATQATTRARRTVVLDGQPGKEYNASSISSILFTPDNRHYVYSVARIEGQGNLVVADGRESNSYGDTQDLHLSADGTSAIFFASDSSRILRVTTPLR